MIFYDAIAGVARPYIQSAVDLLAITIAHEIGHLLLPHPAHATSGVMRADWEGDDLRHAVHEELRFTAVQAQHIRLKLSGASEKSERVEWIMRWMSSLLVVCGTGRRPGLGG